MLEPINLRFAQLIQQVGLSKNAFAMSLGKTASVIQHLIDGRNKPGYDLLCKVFEVYPNVSKDWLMEGTGPMMRPSAATAELPLAAPAPATEIAPPVVPAPVAAPPAPVVAAVAPAAEPVALAAPAPTAAVPPAPAEVALAPGPQAAQPVAVPAPVAAPAPLPVLSESYLAVALQTQSLQHQLAMAELRNQNLLEQQRMLREMLDLARAI